MRAHLMRWCERNERHDAGAVRWQMEPVVCGAMVRVDHLNEARKVLRALIGQMNIEAVETLAGHAHLNGCSARAKPCRPLWRRPVASIKHQPAPGRRSCGCQTSAPPHVVERPLVGAYTVVVSGALFSRKRPHAP